MNNINEINVIINLALAGEPKAIEELINRLEPLRKSILSSYPVLDMDEYNQLLSILTLDALKEYDGSSHFLYYIKNRYTWFIKDDVKKLREVPLSNEIAETLESESDIENEYIYNGEQLKIKAIVDNALARLSATERDVIVKYYYEGKYMREIAEEMSISPRTVAKYKNSALKNMKRYIKKEYGEIRA